MAPRSMTRGTLFLVMVAVVTTGCRADRRAIESAEKLFNAGHLDSAKIQYQAFVTDFPTSQWRDLAERQLGKTNELVSLRRGLDDAVALMGSDVVSYDLRSAETVHSTASLLVRRIAEFHPSLIDSSTVLHDLDSGLSAIASRVAAVEIETARKARAEATRRRVEIRRAREEATRRRVERQRAREEAEPENRRTALRRRIGTAVDLRNQYPGNIVRRRPRVFLWRTETLRDTLGVAYGAAVNSLIAGDVAVIEEISQDLNAARVVILFVGGNTAAGWITTRSLGLELSRDLCGYRLVGQPDLIRQCGAAAAR